MHYEKNIIKFKIFEADDILWEMRLGESHSAGRSRYTGKTTPGPNRWKVQVKSISAALLIRNCIHGDIGKVFQPVL